MARYSYDRNYTNVQLFALVIISANLADVTSSFDVAMLRSYWFSYLPHNCTSVPEAHVPLAHACPAVKPVSKGPAHRYSARAQTIIYSTVGCACRFVDSNCNRTSSCPSSSSSSLLIALNLPALSPSLLTQKAAHSTSNKLAAHDHTIP